jgi:hypothetical protein
VELTVYQGPLDTIPEPDLPYGFAAWNNVEAHLARSTLRRESCYELNLRYLGIDPKNHLYRFEPVTFQGHEYYQGASGAPIADPTGLIVSMLVGGNKKGTVLWGVPLATHAKKLMATGPAPRVKRTAPRRTTASKAHQHKATSRPKKGTTGASSKKTLS